MGFQREKKWKKEDEIEAPELDTSVEYILQMEKENKEKEQKRIIEECDEAPFTHRNWCCRKDFIQLFVLYSLAMIEMVIGIIAYVS